MPKIHIFVYLAAGIWYTVFVALGLFPSGNLQLAAMVATLPLGAAYMASLSIFLRNCRAISSYFPLAYCVLLLATSPFTIRTLEPVVFQMNFSALQALLLCDDVSSLPAGTYVELPLFVKERQFTYFAAAERTADGTLLLIVATEAGFPVKHSGYAYSSSGSVTYRAKVLEDWYYFRPVSPNWFRVYD